MSKHILSFLCIYGLINNCRIKIFKLLSACQAKLSVGNLNQFFIFESCYGKKIMFKSFTILNEISLLEQWLVKILNFFIFVNAKKKKLR